MSKTEHTTGTTATPAAAPAVGALLERGVRRVVPKRATARMTLKDFATMAGVTVERCDKEWGGTWAYKTADNPRCTCCGHRTEAALYRAWAEDTFGKAAFKALAKLLSA